MSDLISREQAIEAISELPVKVDNLGYTWMIAGDVLKQIDALPSAEPERKWTPVTEALPEKCQRVLVTIKRTDGEMRVRSGNYFYDYFWIDNGEYWKCNEVLAWMPLPEPLRGE